MISNLYIYNLKGPDSFMSKLIPSRVIRRKISLSKISAITISVTSFEFIIHVQEETDYRYSSIEKYKNHNNNIYIYTYTIIHIP